jgi:hypothetical protein
MTLVERGLDTPTVSLRRLLEGGRAPVDGQTDVDLEDYVAEILASGFPGLRGLPERLARAQLDGYVDRIIDRDFDELGRKVRRPANSCHTRSAPRAVTATSTYGRPTLPAV